ncbi:MAG: putative O-linked N-acetylglucosamine transferase, family [Phenylobacterium sp.]|nr:putative O-linked N-acetylglucosamine transferase, family [Phenylobacterium sp.]
MSALAAQEGLGNPNWLAQGVAAFHAGDLPTAISSFQARVMEVPADFEARYWLSSAAGAAGATDQAAALLEEARVLHAHAVLQVAGVDLMRLRTDKAYCAAIGQQLYGRKLMAAASDCLGRALDFDNLDPELMIAYGLSLQHQGRIQEAVHVFTAASEISINPSVHQFLLYPLFYVEDRMARVSAESRRWGELYAAAPPGPPPRFHNNRKTDRRLRIGYVGPSFTRNQVAPSTVPVFEAHDPQAVDVYLYSPDPAAEGPLPKTCTMRKIGGLSDEDAAEMIRRDRIDILVDVWGHTGGSRLRVFTLRPAPIQFGWINFMQTTGLTCMDYVMHADSMEVPGTEAYFTEEIWRTGEIMAPYRPGPDRHPPVPTPALKNGYVTFGSFNNPAKLNDATVAAWAAILRARPTARLVLKYGLFVDPVLQRVTQARFAARGARPDQLEFRGHTTGPDYTREFQDIDLALDPSPVPGGTTTVDAIANGVPVLVLKGDDFYARTPLPLLLPCGHGELVAGSWDEYVEKALQLTADVAALDALRARVRPAFDASPYRDEVGFTRRLEADYRRMFQRWLDKTA